ncbi:MAG: deoxyribonuclease V [Chloroflexi bacterium]|nr:deoxyribonuclease V [Chloroflexota bacterium]
MKILPTHRWDVSPAEAIQIQRDLVARVSERDEAGALNLVAGVDVGFEGEQKQIARAAIVVLKIPELTLVESVLARRAVKFPYVPGLLAFREAPVILDALAQIQNEPDVIVVDGQGRAHPRRLGIASHLGVLLDCVTIGCAKSILCGKAKDPASRIGASTRLVDRGEVIGAALRTRVNVKPVYISVGHRVSLERALEIILQCCRGFRLPEPTRYAHRMASGSLSLRGAVFVPKQSPSWNKEIASHKPLAMT